MSGHLIRNIYEEMAFIAYHFHWAYEDLMTMEHRERQLWCKEISAINRKLSDKPENIFDV